MYVKGLAVFVAVSLALLFVDIYYIFLINIFIIYEKVLFAGY